MIFLGCSFTRGPADSSIKTEPNVALTEIMWKGSDVLRNVGKVDARVGEGT